MPSPARSAIFKVIPGVRYADNGRGSNWIPAYAGMTLPPAYAGMTLPPAYAGMTLRKDPRLPSNWRFPLMCSTGPT
jgi:hypothetical protein